MKKIAFFVYSVDIAGGVERVVSTITNNLCEDYNVFILNFYGKNRPFFNLNDKINISYLYDQKYRMMHSILNTITELRSFLLKNNIEELIVVDIGLVPQAIIASLGLNVRIIFWNHGNYIPYGIENIPIRVRFSRWLAKKFCSKIITLTERDKNEWDRKKYRADVRVILNPSNYEICEKEPTIKNKVVLALGRMTYQKGFDLLLNAWGKVQSKNGWKLHIVGDGEDKEQLLEIANNLEVQESVCFFPFTNDVSKLYKEASLYCLSSRFEGLPLVLIEAISFGLPVVSFDCYTGPSEIIKKSGILCEPENIEALADSLARFISMKEEEYYAYSENAKLDAQRFKLENIINEWKKIIG